MRPPLAPALSQGASTLFVLLYQMLVHLPHESSCVGIEAEFTLHGFDERFFGVKFVLGA